MDVAAAFEIVPFRHRKFGLVDVLAADDDLLHRPAVDDHRRDGLAVFLHHVLDQVAVGGVVRKAERQREPRAGAKTAGEQLGAAAAGVALDVLEQQRRAFFLQHAAGHRADLAVPIHLGLDPAQLAMLLELRHPLPHVQKAHPALTFAFAGDGTSPRLIAALIPAILAVRNGSVTIRTPGSP